MGRVVQSLVGVYFLFLLPVLHAPADTILIVETMQVPTIATHRDAFLDALQSEGMDERHEIRRYQADGDYSAAVAFLERQREEGPPALVVALATLAAQAAVEVFPPESGVPVLFAVVVDPVGAGVVDHIGGPSGTNVTGIVYSVDRMLKIQTALEILHLEDASTDEGITIGIVHSDYPSESGDVAALQDAAANFPEVTFVETVYPFVAGDAGVPIMQRAIAESLSHLEPDIDFWWEAVGPMSERNGTVPVIAANSRRPVLMAAHPDGVAAGALFTIGPDQVASGHQLAGMAAQILGGTDPGVMPVLPATAFQIAVNVGTAQAIGVVPPSYFLELAGKRVYP